MTPTIQPIRYEVWGMGWRECFQEMRWAIHYAQRQKEYGYPCEVWQISGYVNSNGDPREYHVQVRWTFAEDGAA